MKTKMEETTRTSMGVLLSARLKDRLMEVAQKEHRSLSSQAEVILRAGVEEWEESASSGHKIAASKGKL